MNSSNKPIVSLLLCLFLVILGFIGQLLLYPNLSPLNFNLLHWPDIVSLFLEPSRTPIDLKF